MVDNYTIGSLDVKNFKGAKAFTYQAKEKRLVLLRGPNGAGKSSNLQAIMTALLGDKAAPVRTIRDGSTEATVIATLIAGSGAKLIITHEWARKRDGGTDHKLSVKRVSDGKTTPVARPQSAIDELFNVLTLDPVMFFREKSAEKRASMIQQAAGLDSKKLATLQQEIAAAEETRKQVKRQLDAAAAKVDSLSAIVTKEPQKADNLLAEAEARRIEARTMQDANRSHDGALEAVNATDEEIKDIRGQIETLQTALKQAQDRAACQATTLAQQFSYPEAQIQALLDEAGKLSNQAATSTEQARVWASRLEAEKQRTEFGFAVDQADGKVERLRTQRRSWIAEGLKRAGLDGIVGLDEDGRPLAYGKPVEDISGSERIKAGARLALATKPNVRVLLLDEADALGPEAIKEIDQWAEKEGFQVFLTGVWMQTEAADTIEIADGEVVEHAA